MLRTDEAGVLTGSEYFFNTIAPHKLNLFYSVTQCGYYYCDSNYVIDRSYVDSQLVMLVEKGSLTLDYRGSTVTAHDGDILLLDLASPHRYTTDSSVQFYWMHFTGVNSSELVGYLIRENGGSLYTADRARNAAVLIRNLVRQFATNQLVNDSEQSRLLYSMLCYLMHDAPESKLPSNSPVQRAVRYIQSNLGGDVSIKRLAEEVGISSSHLIRLFRSTMHCSPHEYIIRMRLDRAKYLLKSTDLPIKEIGAQIGYGTESSFTGAFTDKIGVSPRKFREMPLG